MMKDETKPQNPEGASPASSAQQPQTGHLSRKTAAIISWIVVAFMLAFIFYISSRSGNDIDHNTGIFSAIKEWLSVQALALFGREVDVSPVGHFCEYLALGLSLIHI